MLLPIDRLVMEDRPRIPQAEIGHLRNKRPNEIRIVRSAPGSVGAGNRTKVRISICPRLAPLPSAMITIISDVNSDFRENCDITHYHKLNYVIKQKTKKSLASRAEPCYLLRRSLGHWVRGCIKSYLIREQFFLALWQKT